MNDDDQDFPPCPAIMGHFPDLAPTPGPIGLVLKRASELRQTAPHHRWAPKLRPMHKRTGAHDGAAGTREPRNGRLRCAVCWEFRSYPEGFRNPEADHTERMCRNCFRETGGGS